MDSAEKAGSGPDVFICDECVEISNDIIADDARFEKPEERKAYDEPQQAMAEAALAAAGTQVFPCRLCGMPTLFHEALIVEERGGLCAGCVAAVEAAITGNRDPGAGNR